MLQQAYATASPHTSAYVSICQHTSVRGRLEAVCDSKPMLLQALIRQHTSAYASRRQHMLQHAYATASPHTSAYVSICQQTSAYATARLCDSKALRQAAEQQRARAPRYSKPSGTCCAAACLRHALSSVAALPAKPSGKQESKQRAQRMSQRWSS